MAEGIVDLLEEVDIYEYEAYLQFSLFRVRQAMQQMIDIAAIEKAGEKVGVGFFFFFRRKVCLFPRENPLLFAGISVRCCRLPVKKIV